jgi:uncharacterized protein (DUF983 family)
MVRARRPTIYPLAAPYPLVATESKLIPAMTLSAMTAVSVSKTSAMLRGFRQLCPHCGKGQLFRRYLKPVESCGACGESFAHIRADDFPPHLTILAVGHIVVPLMLVADRAGVGLEAQMAIWVPVALFLTLALLPRIKGGIIGFIWSTGAAAS